MVSKGQESFSLNWPGKAECLNGLEAETNYTLKADRESSVDFDNTENLFIEGDNLDVLKLLKDSYYNNIKMIYIDPPYNTGKKRQYKDKFTHKEWANMMYPRLCLARSLLKDDGVIFISIDDNEVAHLRIICDEIFGEGNVELLIWNKEAEGKSGTLKQTRRLRNIHEYIIIAYKNRHSTTFSKIFEISKQSNLQTANLEVNRDKIKQGHANWMEIISPTGKKWYKHWKFNNDKINNFLKNNQIYWGKSGNNQPRLILSTGDERTVTLTSIINKGSTTLGRKNLEQIMHHASLLDFPKPTKLIQHILQISTTPTTKDLILDFFAGSCTTAHAVMKLNAEDGGNRKFIMVQLPEPCDEKSEAHKAGYKTIADIGRERIRRAAQKIKEECAKENKEPPKDLGFKAFKLAKSKEQQIYLLKDNFDDSENVFIEGDNLDVLRLLQDSYHGKVKMIYIDPPYNAGNRLIYRDKFTHAEWANMMYPRLWLARNLLRDDGVIFISIDDNEQHRLRIICDEIFGERNFVGCIAWESKTKSQNTKDAFNKLQPKIEYLLVYGRLNKVRFNLASIGQKTYQHTDERGPYREALVEQMSSSGMRGRKSMIFPILGISPKNGRRWQIGLDAILKFQARGDLLIINGKPHIKMRPSDERTEQTEPFWAFFSKDAGTAESAKRELGVLMGASVFETVKPNTLIQKLVFHCTNPTSQDLILDFFAGSCTTAHAVMKQNAEDGGNRKFIMVQLPEPCDEKSEAFKAGYKTIADIGRERIRRAAQKIKEECAKENKEPPKDMGFQNFLTIKK